MANKARYYIDRNTYDTVTANEAALLKNRSTIKFLCANPKCNVRMALKNSDHPEIASFASYPKQASKHKGFMCTKSGLSFNKHNYSNTLFKKDNFFSDIFEPVISPSKSPYNSASEHHVNNNAQTPPKNVKQLYPLLATSLKTDTYGDTIIGDYYIDTENYNESMPINGSYILETSFYKYNSTENSVTLNFPIHNMKHTHIKVIFDDNEMFLNFISKIKYSTHTEIIPIGGIWKSTDKDDPISICHIKSQRQFAIFKP